MEARVGCPVKLAEAEHDSDLFGLDRVDKVADQQQRQNHQRDQDQDFRRWSTFEWQFDGAKFFRHGTSS